MVECYVATVKTKVIRGNKGLDSIYFDTFLGVFGGIKKGYWGWGYFILGGFWEMYGGVGSFGKRCFCKLLIINIKIKILHRIDKLFCWGYWGVD
jgi:hypothetical protein